MQQQNFWLRATRCEDVLADSCELDVNFQANTSVYFMRTDAPEFLWNPDESPSNKHAHTHIHAHTDTHYLWHSAGNRFTAHSTQHFVPKQFISVLKVLRYLIVPKSTSTLQLNLCPALNSLLCCCCQIDPSLCWCSTTGQSCTGGLITSAYQISCPSILWMESSTRPPAGFMTPWELEVLSVPLNQLRKPGQGSGTKIEKEHFYKDDTFNVAWLEMIGVTANIM